MKKRKYAKVLHVRKCVCVCVSHRAWVCFACVREFVMRANKDERVFVFVYVVSVGVNVCLVVVPQEDKEKN